MLTALERKTRRNWHNLQDNGNTNNNNKINNKNNIDGKCRVSKCNSGMTNRQQTLAYIHTYVHTRTYVYIRVHASKQANKHLDHRIEMVTCKLFIVCANRIQKC